MSMRCLDLTDDAATDPSVAGAKAAGLARAQRAGLPVLPGVIVPVAEARDVVEAVTPALAAGNAGKARLAAMRVQPDPDLISELQDRVATHPTPLIVRSSSPLEADGTWSGAFSSFHGIAVDELGTAVRGCWGAAFSVGVLDRAERTETPVDQLNVAVLIQPELHPDLGGTARLAHGGEVRVTATSGPLTPLMAGHVEGITATVTPDGRVDASHSIDQDVVLAVAALSRQVGEQLDHQLIEWAAVDGEVTLLQSLRSPEPTAPVELGDIDPALATPTAQRVASLTQRYAGRLAEELVLPWAASLPVLPDPVTPPRDLDPVAALATARSEASAMITLLWGGSPRAAAAEADRVLRQLRGDDPAAALARIAALPEPVRDTAATVLGHLGLVRDHLLADRLLDGEAAFWRLTGDALDELLAGREPVSESRFGVDRWEPFIHCVVRANGEHRTGTPGAPGAGAGRAFLVHDARTQPSPTGRYVLVASEPGPELGPLLWNAAGLVTRAGSTAAHLIEFAHSIGVPTVVGCDLPRFTPEDAPLIAVDGDAGIVAVAADQH